MTAVSKSEYWDYPFENCMVRETRTGEGHTNQDYEIAIKFYGKDEWIVDISHRLYRDVLRGGGSTITPAVYEAGKTKPQLKAYTPRPPARYWDYPQAQCMIRESPTGSGLSIGIKFYGQRQQRVDESHDLYQQVLQGAGSSISAAEYSEGKPPSDAVDDT